MTIRNIIKELKSRGYNVSFYERKDRGVRITRINGETFSGSSGNKRARIIVGATLTEAQALSLSKLITPKGKGNYNKRRKAPIDEETKEKIRKLQYQYRKAGKTEGKPTIRNYRYVLKAKGKKEADRLLKQAEKRILGYAYNENVETLLLRMKKDETYFELKNIPHLFFSEAVRKVERLKNAFLDKWIYPIYEVLYDVEMATIDPNTAGDRILMIISF